MGRVIVIGSANHDTSVAVDPHPGPGETVLGDLLGSGAGGKGLNQAIAAARFDAPTTFVGAVGDDAAAELVRDALRGAGARSILAASTRATGSAFVMVAPSGENAIVVVSGANGDTAALAPVVDEALEDAGAGDVVIAQLEIPLEVVHRGLRAARSRGAVTILNAAPSRTLPSELLAAVDILIVNEHECLDLATGAGSDTERAARDLASTVPAVIVTLGADGALVVTAAGREHVPAHRVEVVDTTAAGDTFCGVVAAVLARGLTMTDAVHAASAASALTVGRSGAAASIPARADVLAFADSSRART